MKDALEAMGFIKSALFDYDWFRIDGPLLHYAVVHGDGDEASYWCVQSFGMTHQNAHSDIENVWTNAESDITPISVFRCALELQCLVLESREKFAALTT